MKWSEQDNHPQDVGGQTDFEHDLLLPAERLLRLEIQRLNLQLLERQLIERRSIELHSIELPTEQLVQLQFLLEVVELQIVITQLFAQPFLFEALLSATSFVG